jgi:hypothetical protein
MIKVLYAAANPLSDLPMDLVREYTMLLYELSNCRTPERFAISYEPNLAYFEVERLIAAHRPNFVHICAPTWINSGLLLHTSRDASQTLTQAEIFSAKGDLQAKATLQMTVFAQLLKKYAVDAVLVTSILSREQLRALSKACPAIAFDNLVTDKVAQQYVRHFYKHLMLGRGFKAAHDAGYDALLKQGTNALPHLDFRDVDVTQLFRFETIAAPLAHGALGKARLRDKLRAQFNSTELHLVCDELDIAWDALGGGAHADVVRELIAYCERRSRLPELSAIVLTQRPESKPE